MRSSDRRTWPGRRPSVRRSGSPALLAVLLAACGGGGNAPASAPGSDGGADGDATDNGPIYVRPRPDVATCDPTQEPATEPCLVADAYGVFVSTAGSDANDGSMAHPFATIGHALTHAGGKGRVYVCAGSYAERVAVVAPISLYGGFACRGADGGASGWAPGGGATTVAPAAYDPQQNYVLSIVGLATSAISVEDMSFVAPPAVGQDASGNGNSSVAGIIIGSAVTLRAVAFTASAGVDGQNGDDGAAHSNYSGGSSAPDGVGASALACDGGAQCPPGPVAVVVCTALNSACGGAESSTGGLGGDWAAAGPTPGRACPAAAPTGGLHDGQAAPPAPGTPNGDPGAFGGARAAGQAATVLGAITITSGSTTWTPSHGGDGMPGSAGGGGGGGRALAVASGGTANITGGSGAAGGCGGSGGNGGGGGGASIALMSIDNAPGPSLDTCTFETGAGGHGGTGGAGQISQAGGSGGAGMLGPQPDMVGAGAGGAGGNGAGGSGGAGGTGGVSAGILYRGAVPVCTGCSFTVGAAGRGGDPGPVGTFGMNPRQPPAFSTGGVAGNAGATGYDEYQAYGASLPAQMNLLQIP